MEANNEIDNIGPLENGVHEIATNEIDEFGTLEKGDREAETETEEIEDFGTSEKEDHETVPECEGESNENTNSYERKILPPELSRSAVTLTCDSSAEGGVCDVYLVGTAHVSAESCKEVQAVIDFLKPQVVFLELCAGRVAVLAPQDFKGECLWYLMRRVHRSPSDSELMEVPTVGEMLEMWKKNQSPFGILYGWFLAKVATKLEVFPGAEFRVAYEEAMKYGGKVILGDRPVQITLRRTWAKMPLWHKTKLVYSFLFQAVFLPSPEDLNKALKEMDDIDMLTLVIQEMSKQFPTLMETLVYERDQYMSAKLLNTASHHNSVVAVLGKGHLPGIRKNWKQPVDLKEILTIPTQERTLTVRKILGTIGVTVLGVSIISGLYLSYKK